MEDSWIIYRRADTKMSPTRRSANSGGSTQCVSKADVHSQNLLDKKTLV